MPEFEVQCTPRTEQESLAWTRYRLDCSRLWNNRFRYPTEEYYRRLESLREEYKRQGGRFSSK